MSKESRFRVVVIILISLPFDLNLIWSITGAGWLYWMSWFLGSFEQLIAGTLLILFPKVMQRWLGIKADIRIAVLFILLGTYFLIRGSENSYYLVNRWLAECMNIVDCLK